MAQKDIPYFVQLIRMSGKIIVGGILIIVLFAFGTGVLSGPTTEVASNEIDYAYSYGDQESENSLLRVDITGSILGTPPDFAPDPFGLLGPTGITYGYEIKETLMEAAKNDAIKGVLMHISSPGGTVFGSMAIYDGIEAYQKETGNPVVVYIEGLSASGGVMAMVGADEIYADTGSFIGSIGVVGGVVYYYDRPKALHGGILGGGVTTEGGISQTVISAGRSKDLGNPFRRMTDEERATLQQSVDGLYDFFVEHVSKARKMPEKQIVETMGAQLFGNSRAEELGLIDGTRSWNESLDALAKLAGVRDDFKLVRPERAREDGLLSLFVSIFQPNKTDAQREERRRAASASLCEAAQTQILAYHGPLTRLCPAG